MPQNKTVLVMLCIGVVIVTGCARPSGPLATLPMTSPVASVYNLQGIKLFNQGQWEAAKAQFEQALRADSQLAEAHFNLALTFHKLDRHDDAKREFRRAGELAPDNQTIVGDSLYRNHLGLGSTFERHIGGGYKY